jgi:nucleotide-binding universal stress UspA family protein
MFRKIIVPLDGSPLAECALPYAAALAKASGAKVYLVRAAMAHTGLDPDSVGDEVNTVQAAEEYLSRTAIDLPRVQVETAVFYGNAREAIVEEISLRKIDLVVMATHGRSGVSRLLFGSVAAHVLAHSPEPILLVRAWQHEHDVAAFGGAPRLLVPLDGSSSAEEALPVAREVAAALGGSIHLLSAVQVPVEPRTDAAGRVVSYLDQQVDALKHESTQYLHQLAEQLKDDERGAPAVHVDIGEPVDVIVGVSRQLDVAMIVMATHGRTGLARMLMGSVAGEVLRQADLPLLLVRPAVGPHPG